MPSISPPAPSPPCRSPSACGTAFTGPGFPAANSSADRREPRAMALLHPGQTSPSGSPQKGKALRLTKWGHACVSLTRPSFTIVIDPGVLTEPAALDGADAVLLTHEHPDHFAEDRLRAAAEANPGLRIWTNRSVAAQLTGLGSRVTTVGDGDRF